MRFFRTYRYWRKMSHLWHYNAIGWASVDRRLRVAISQATCHASNSTCDTCQRIERILEDTKSIRFDRKEP